MKTTRAQTDDAVEKLIADKLSKTHEMDKGDIKPNTTRLARLFNLLSDFANDYQSAWLPGAHRNPFKDDEPRRYFALVGSSSIVSFPSKESRSAYCACNQPSKPIKRRDAVLIRDAYPEIQMWSWMDMVNRV